MVCGKRQCWMVTPESYYLYNPPECCLPQKPLPCLELNRPEPLPNPLPDIVNGHPELEERLREMLAQLYGAALQEEKIETLLNELESRDFIWSEELAEQANMMSDLFRRHDLQLAQIDILVTTAALTDNFDAQVALTDKAARYLMVEKLYTDANALIEPTLQEVSIDNLAQPGLLVDLTKSYADCCRALGGNHVGNVVENLADNFAHLIKQNNQ